jgi:5-methylcytosine-specific restriction endonuclease McrA
VTVVNGVLCLNADYSVLTSVSWQRAVTLIVSGRAEIHEADPDQFVRGRTLQVPFPRVIRLLKWVYVKFTGRSHDGAGVCTKAGVLKRDAWTCGYCGSKASTVDHVFPESRGGAFSWDNLIAACEDCNGFKANRTPEEAGMRLKWHPYRPDIHGMEQRKVWASLLKLEIAGPGDPL